MKTKELTLKEAIEAQQSFTTPRHSGVIYIFKSDDTLEPRLVREYLNSKYDFPHDLEDILIADYELEQPEPRTEKRWLYNFISPEFTRPLLSDMYFRNDEDFKNYHFKATWFQKIEDSGREFPVLDSQ